MAAKKKPAKKDSPKLAEALLLRADMQKKVASLRERVVANAVVQEGEKPNEDPSQLLLEAMGALSDLEVLVARINKTNLMAKLPDGRTLTEAIAKRDALVQQHALLQAAAAGSRKEPDRYGVREIKWVAMMDVRKLQKQCDDLARSIREINGAIQETNWKVVLEG
ncbi:MAG: DIP1984 family protein [Deltaproteobacteria bacterium]|nr:DIP1984 family protein [Deltaproteobacteria bacterium]